MNRIYIQWALSAAALLLFVQPAMAQPPSKGEGIYKANCMTCHGEDGGGSMVGKSLHAPNLRSRKVQSKSNAALARFIANGHGAMPSFSESLNHSQIVDVARYVHSLPRKRK